MAAVSKRKHPKRERQNYMASPDLISEITWLHFHHAPCIRAVTLVCPGSRMDIGPALAEKNAKLNHSV